MNPTRPGEPTPTPRPGTGPQLPVNQEDEKETVKSRQDVSIHPEEMDRKEVESEMPANPDPDDPVSP